MQKFEDALLEEKQRLEKIIAKAKMENAHMPEGYLRISKCKNRCRYYHCIKDRNGTYISKKILNYAENWLKKCTTNRS